MRMILLRQNVRGEAKWQRSEGSEVQGEEVLGRIVHVGAGAVEREESPYEPLRFSSLLQACSGCIFTGSGKNRAEECQP